MEGQLKMHFNKDQESSPKYLEDISDWPMKLKKYQLVQNYDEVKRMWGGRVRAEEAESNVRYLNGQYGPGTAVLGMESSGLRIVSINKPIEGEFSEILKNGILLPMRPEKETIEMDTSRKNEAA